MFSVKLFYMYCASIVSLFVFCLFCVIIATYRVSQKVTPKNSNNILVYAKPF